MSQRHLIEYSAAERRAVDAIAARLKRGGRVPFSELRAIARENLTSIKASRLLDQLRVKLGPAGLETSGRGAPMRAWWKLPPDSGFGRRQRAELVLVSGPPDAQAVARDALEAYDVIEASA